jgi:hypothetical protein
MSMLEEMGLGPDGQENIGNDCLAVQFHPADGDSPRTPS